MSTKFPTTYRTTYPTLWRSTVKRGRAGISGNPGAYNPIGWYSAESLFLKTNGSRVFNGTNQYFNLATNADVAITGNLFISGWIYPTASALQGFLSKWASAQQSYKIELSATTNLLSFLVSVTGSNAFTVTGTNALSLNAWSFFFAWFDASAQTINLQLNNDAIETPVSIASSTIFDSTTDFMVGRSEATYLTGRGYQAILGSPTVSFSTIRDRLWNNGNPLDLSDLTPTELTDWGCENTRWQLSEASGNAIPVSGSNILTDNNSVGSDVGPPNRIAVNSVDNTENGTVIPSDGSEDQIWSSDTPGGSGLLYSIFPNSVRAVDTVGTQQTLKYIHETGIFEFECDFRLSDYTVTTPTNTFIVDNNRISNVDNGFSIRWIPSTNALRVQIFNGSGSSVNLEVPGAVADNSWHNLKVTGDGATMNVILDSVSIGTQTIVTGAGDARYNLRIGENAFTGGSPLPGYISNVRFRDAIGGNLTHQWKLDEGPSGNTLVTSSPINEWRDKSAYRNNKIQTGTLQRPIWNSNGYVSFDGINNYMMFLKTTLSDLLSGDDIPITLFFVMNTTQAGIGYNGRIVNIRGSVASLYPFISNTPSGQIGITKVDEVVASVTVNTPNGFPNSNLQLGTYRLKGTPQILDYWLNTTQLQTNTPFNVGNCIFTESYFATATGSNQFLRADVYEWVIYNRSLLDEEISAIQQNLMGKYGITP